MAEKQEEEEAPNSLQGLMCPLCLDIFDDATLLTSCGHTFCRQCLKKYDLSHQDLDHMVCPLCRKVTKLSVNRVDDLLSDVKVNGLVDDFHAKSGGVNAVLENRQLCTVCKRQEVAISFCITCNTYMCDKCHVGHKQLKLFFEGHEIISIQDITEGKVSIGHSSEKCSIHKQENKDMFCEDCKVQVCFKCVIIGHRNHKIKSHDDFEKELRLKVNDLIQRCIAKKSELEKNIQNVESQRSEVHTNIQKLREDVCQAYRTKVNRLEENQRILVEQIDALQRSFDEDLNALKSNDRHRIKSICSSMTLVANDRLGRLETDSLSAHKLLCEELESMLKEVTDATSAAVVTRKAQKKRFQPADDTIIELGNISELDTEPAIGGILKGRTDMTGDTSATAITEKAQRKRFQPAYDTSLELANITEPDPELKVINSVDLRGRIYGMTNYSDNSVAVGYSNVHGIDFIDSNGKQQQYADVSRDAVCSGLVFQRDRTLCISTGNAEAHIYSPNGSRKSTIHVTSNEWHLNLSRSPSDEILVTNSAKHVYIYDPTGSTLKHTVPTKHNITKQACATKTGLIVTSSCYDIPSVVSVYDRDGSAGKPLRAPSDVYLYATVDEQDRVYVADVDRKNCTVVIKLFDLDGQNLKERVRFNTLNLTLKRKGCYMVSLSPTMLAFACYKKLYFIQVVM